ncbi:COX15/CtaA family protein [Porticoccus litoralis]|uniref:COX15/CtaA family protein n=1 Tax=Porticoccus litoralis TaxID=434086 RepID=A0AAW8B628_9GAMM|nr:COX15/CtaA family protein [Porticoccus litoralis]MDP1520805.1 COX15/CtaA family protein [Porticoccus litoralis]
MIRFSKPKHQKAGFSLALVATVVAALVLLLGVLTRLSDAGLGCEGWPSCYGSSLQAGSMDTAPESVLTSTAEIEIFHRYLAAVLGLMVIMLAIISWRRREMEEYPFRLPTLILFLVAWQAVFGMWSVTLKLLPQVVTFHLIAGMVTFSLIWLLTLRLGSRPWELNEKTDLQLQRLKPWLLVLMAALLLQIGLGGWTSANYAAFACSDFPTCQGEWWPDMDFRQGFDFTQPVGPSYLGGKLETEARVAIHVTHRIAGLVLAVLTVIIATPLLRIKNSQVRVLTATFVMLMLTELLLGVANNLLMAPMLTALLHHLISALLLLVLVALMTGIWLAKPRYQRQES